MFERFDETIAAISSPPGSGIRGIIRLSGPRAFELADALFSPAEGARLTEAAGHHRIVGTVQLDSRAALPAEAYTFRAPASYTRQDLVELHTLGSVPVLALVLEKLVEGGARVAEPGEFTGRAFLSGRLDLTAVEGVAATIHAQSDSQLRASTALMNGALSRQTRDAREELADLLALIEAELDFSEEAIEFVTRSTVLDTVQRTKSRLEQLLLSGASTERLEALPRVVLVGLPNAGKSTLFNRLTGMDRAIQSAVAGTTRDVLAAPVPLAGGEIILCDTAGMTAGHQGSTDVMQPLEEAIEASTQRALGSADLILVVIDASDRPEEAARFISARLAGHRSEIVHNKMDLVVNRSEDGGRDILARISADRGRGLSELVSRIDEILFASAEKHGGQLISLTQRHRGALQEACDALSRAAAMTIDDDSRGHMRLELLALEIRHAVHALSLLLGEVTTEDLLGRIFARFCIGK